MTPVGEEGEAEGLLMSQCVCVFVCVICGVQILIQVFRYVRCVRLYNVRHSGRAARGGSNAQWDKVRQAGRRTDRQTNIWTVGQPLSCLSVTVIVCPGK